MNVFTRGIRNAFRNSIRTFSIVLILGLSIGLTLAMLAARAAVEDKIESVKTSIGSTVTIMPAGVQGFQGGGEPLTIDQLSKVRTIPHVTKLSETLNDRLTADTSNLKSAIEPGTLGRRGAANSGVGFSVNGGEAGGTARLDTNGTDQIVRTFTPPVIVTGTNDPLSKTVYGGETVTYTSGQAFEGSSNEDIAVIGKDLAEKNSLSVGSTFTAYGQTIKVVGIYDTGSTFSNDGVIMPLASLQRLSDQATSVTAATATIDSIENIEAVVTAIKSDLGDKADVTSTQDSVKQAIQPLENVKTISAFSVFGAVGAGAIIILLTMVMIVRERRREIGVFKAIGASNVKVMLQFISEAVTLTVLALFAGLIIGIFAANPVTKTLVNNSASSTPTVQDDGAQNVRTFSAGTRPAGGISTFGGPVFRQFRNNTVANVRNVQASVGTKTIALGVLAAFVIAAIGSAIPAFLISKIRPAEVMRAE